VGEELTEFCITEIPYILILGVLTEMSKDYITIINLLYTSVGLQHKLFLN
jgi:hypothetical protein